jgi:uncharacterized protein (DUF2252 family)
MAKAKPAAGRRAAPRKPATAPEPRVSPAVAPELQAVGRSARKEVPRSRLGAWAAPAGPRDPLVILQQQAQGRGQDLEALRYARMAASAAVFHRGSAALMAHDLGTQRSTGLIVQLAGDAHLANFGGFATAERTLVFDLNDFDETLPGPFEWDVKRLVASFEVAGRSNGYSSGQRAAIVAAVASEYCSAMAEFAGMSRLDVWSARMQAEDVVNRWVGTAHSDRIASFQRTLAKGHKRASAGALSRYTTQGPDGALRIISDPPFVEPAGQLAGDGAAEERAAVEGILAAYRTSLSDDLKVLLDGYRLVDVARKGMGVGSAGARCWIALLVGEDDAADDLVLQLKEAHASVLEPVAGNSAYSNHGRRIVEGQRLMQASTDVLLGWTRVRGGDGVQRDYYVRQMWDWKTSPDLDAMDHLAMGVYARVCGWTLARAHVRSGNRYAIAAYVGSGRTFTRAMQEFADAYADQNQRDHQAFLAAIAEDRTPDAAATQG